MEKLSQILTDLEQGKISADHAEAQILRLFPTNEQMWSAATIDYQNQKEYETAYDRKKGFIQGAKWAKQHFIKS